MGSDFARWLWFYTVSQSNILIYDLVILALVKCQLTCLLLSRPAPKNESCLVQLLKMYRIPGGFALFTIAIDFCFYLFLCLILIWKLSGVWEGKHD